MRGYRIVRNTYHAVVPERWRDRIFEWSPPLVRTLKRRVVQSLENDAKHDDLYDDVYFGKFVEPTMQLSASVIARSIHETFRPRTVIDVGCGTGVLLLELSRLGVAVQGLELAEAGLAACRRRGLIVTKFDVEKDPAPAIRADLVVSTEVAEHLPAECADRFVALLSALADVVVLTAAVPGQGGTDHVNEQPNEYWIRKFAAGGRRLDERESSRWRDAWKARGVAGCYWSSLMIFRPAGDGNRPVEAPYPPSAQDLHSPRAR